MTTPTSIDIDRELSRCPECGYEDGFHVSFQRRDDGALDVILICPSCSARFTVGWAVREGDDR